MRRNKNRQAVDYLLTLIDSVVTFCESFSKSTDPEALERIIRHARSVYAISLRYAGGLSFTPKVVKAFELAATRLETVISILQVRHDAIALPAFGIQAVLSGSGTKDRRHDHSVVFYEDDTQLMGQVVGYIGGALFAGNAAIVVATRPHRNELNRRLRLYGLDIKNSQLKHRYFVFDAAKTLERFIVNGTPDAGMFSDIANPLLKRAQLASENAAGVAIYAEMVAVLWKLKMPKAALQLERFWNELALTKSFSLLCGYPSALFDEGRDQKFMQLCAEHSQVVSSSAR